MRVGRGQLTGTASRRQTLVRLCSDMAIDSRHSHKGVSGLRQPQSSDSSRRKITPSRRAQGQISTWSTLSKSSVASATSAPPKA